MYYEVALRRLADQMQQIDGLDGKVGATFGLASGAFPLFAAAIAFSGTDLPWYQWVLLGFGLVAYLGLAYHCYRAIQVREFDLRPDLPSLGSLADERDEATVLTWVGDECTEAFAHNAPLADDKATHLTAAIKLLPIEIVFLVVATLIALA